MHWPQWTYVGLVAVNMLLSCAKHGEPRTEKWDGSVTIIASGISCWLLWMGGFFG